MTTTDTTNSGAAANNYENGPEGMPRVKRMTDSVLECLIGSSLFRHLANRYEGEDRDRLHGLMHDTAEEVLARLPAWPTAAATQATSGEAFRDHLQRCSDEVATWPDWKRRATVPMSGEQIFEIAAPYFAWNAKSWHDATSGTISMTNLLEYTKAVRATAPAPAASAAGDVIARESIIDVDGLPRLMADIIESKGTPDALGRLYDFVNEWGDTRVRTALAAQAPAAKAEPVAWMSHAGSVITNDMKINRSRYAILEDYAAMHRTPLYTATVEQAKLLTIIGHCYQMAGAIAAPASVLDVLADPEAATDEQVGALAEFNPVAQADDVRDAERYRWLRDPDTDVALVLDKRTGYVEPVEGMPGIGGYHTYEYRAGEELDAAIDEAMKRTTSAAPADMAKACVREVRAAGWVTLATCERCGNSRNCTSAAPADKEGK